MKNQMLRCTMNIIDTVLSGYSSDAELSTSFINDYKSFGVENFIAIITIDFPENDDNKEEEPKVQWSKEEIPETHLILLSLLYEGKKYVYYKGQRHDTVNLTHRDVKKLYEEYKHVGLAYPGIYAMIPYENEMNDYLKKLSF